MLIKAIHSRTISKFGKELIFEIARNDLISSALRGGGSGLFIRGRNIALLCDAGGKQTLKRHHYGHVETIVTLWRQ